MLQIFSVQWVDENAMDEFNPNMYSDQNKFGKKTTEMFSKIQGQVRTFIALRTQMFRRNLLSVWKKISRKLMIVTEQQPV